MSLQLELTFPPEAQSEPSGETVTQLRKPVWPKWFVFSLQLVRFQTCKGDVIVMQSSQRKHRNLIPPKTLCKTTHTFHLPVGNKIKKTLLKSKQKPQADNALTFDSCIILPSTITILPSRTKLNFIMNCQLLATKFPNSHLAGLPPI